MKFKRLLFVLLFAFPSISFAQKSLTGADSARMVIDSVLNYARANSLHRDSVNWEALTDSVKKHSAAAANIKEAMPALKVMFKMLGDFHGAAYFNGLQYKWVTTVTKRDYKPYNDLLKRIRQEQPHIETRLLERGYGYLAIPANNPTKAGEVDAIAKQIQDSLTKLNPAKLKGIVIDMRKNAGGTMSPMILGIGNLFSKVKLGSFVYPNGKKEWWYIKDKIMYADTEKEATIPAFCKVNPRIKIAVLTSPFTASSAEATVISFKGQKNARVVGDATAGYTTANESMFYMGVQVLLANSVEADRNGHVYYQNVKPDIEVIAGDDFNDFSKDQKIIAAMKWLKEK